MSTWIHAGYAIVHLGLAVWLARLASGSPDARLRCAAAIVCLIAAGLVYDNAIIAAGASIGAGDLLRALSVPRFWLHALATPLIVFAVLQILAAAGTPWARARSMRAVTIAVVAVLIAIGIYEDATLELHVTCFDGTMRYSPNVLASQLCGPEYQPVSGGGPPVPSIVTTLWVLVAGVILWRRAGVPWLVAGAVFMFAGASVPFAKMGLVPGNGTEILLTAGLALAIARVSARQSAD